MSALSKTFQYDSLDADLAQISQAAQCCVLAGLLINSLDFVRQMAEYDSDGEKTFLKGHLHCFIGCLKRLVPTLDSVHLQLRELHANNGRRITTCGQHFASYCDAAESMGREHYVQIVFACDDTDLEHAYFIHGEIQEIPESMIVLQRSEIARRITALPKLDFDDLRLGIDNEFIESTRAAGAQEPEVPEVARVNVDVDKEIVTLDGSEYEVKSKQALRWIKVLSEHRGEWIPSTGLSGYDEELDGFRPDKIRKYIPPEIDALIENSPGKGSRLMRA